MWHPFVVDHPVGATLHLILPAPTASFCWAVWALQLDTKAAGSQDNSFDPIQFTGSDSGTELFTGRFRTSGHMAPLWYPASAPAFISLVLPTDATGDVVQVLLTSSFPLFGTVWAEQVPVERALQRGWGPSEEGE